MLAQKGQSTPSRGHQGETQSAGKSLYNSAIFSNENIQTIDFEVKCSYVEIYNETIYDLLDIGQQKL